MLNVIMLNVVAPKLELTSQILGRVFNSKSGRMEGNAFAALFSKTVQLKVENLDQTALWLSPFRFSDPGGLYYKLFAAVCFTAAYLVI
jgi:hypothetical protein